MASFQRILGESKNLFSFVCWFLSVSKFVALKFPYLLNNVEASKFEDKI